MATVNLPMSKSEMMKIQALLEKTGYTVGEIDGVFRSSTSNAIMQFQKDYGIEPSGNIDSDTSLALQPFLLGYNMHTILPDDSLSSIAQQFNTTDVAIETANLGVNPHNLIAGHQLIVPYGFHVVDTNIEYTYRVLEHDIAGLKARYPYLAVSVAGISVLSQNLYYLKLGKGENKVFYNATHHGLEWITSAVLMKFAEDFLEAYSQKKLLDIYNPQDIWEQSTIYIMPMVNPDGADLVLNGLSPCNPYYNDLLKWNGGSHDFSSTWQANNRGVDLNHNYNAAWALSKEAEASYYIAGPGPTRYSGAAPETEPETRAVVNLTRANDFRLVMAYHSQGQVIYWNFMNMASSESKAIGRKLSGVSGYSLDNTTGIASYSGYKDWFIQDFDRPGYTIEVGLGKNPLPISQFDEIYQDNIGMLLYAALV